MPHVAVSEVALLLVSAPVGVSALGVDHDHAVAAVDVGVKVGLCLPRSTCATRLGQPRAAAGGVHDKPTAFDVFPVAV